jgi:hypothetical protein
MIVPTLCVGTVKAWERLLDQTRAVCFSVTSAGDASAK